MAQSHTVYHPFHLALPSECSDGLVGLLNCQLVAYIIGEIDVQSVDVGVVFLELAELGRIPAHGHNAVLRRQPS